MILSVYLLLFGIAIIAVLYGVNYGHTEMLLVAFAFTFILGLVLAGAGNLIGGAGGVEFATGSTESYVYDGNTTNIDTITIAPVYTTYSSVFYGSWVAILSFFGFLGAMMSGTMRWFS